MLSDPAQYGAFVAALPAGGLDRATRRRFATRAFERTAEYDSAIARYLESGLLANELPGSLALTIPIEQPLRYGENPQDRAAFYLAREAQLPEQLGGKALSYNNLLDLDATLRAARARAAPACDAPPPAGVPRRARRDRQAHRPVRRRRARRSVADAVRDALDADPVSAYGGIIAVDGTIDARRGRASGGLFSRDRRRAGVRATTRSRGCASKKNLRIMRYRAGDAGDASRAELRVRSALGGVLAEDDDPQAPARTLDASCRSGGRRRAEWRDLIFAWDVVRHVKSNGVVIARDGVSRGICAGQTNRVSAVQIAAHRAHDVRARRGVRQRRLLPVRRRADRRRRRGLHGGHRAAGLDPRRRGDRRRRRARHRARVLDLPLLPALTRMIGFIVRLVGYALLLGVASRIAQTLWSQRRPRRVGVAAAVPRRRHRRCCSSRRSCWR